MGTETALPQLITLDQIDEVAKSYLKQELKAEVVLETEQLYEQKLRIWKTKELADLESRQESKIEELVAKWTKEQEELRKPLSREEIATMLNQEYIEFPVKLKADGTEREFTIAELPQAAEKKFYDKFQSKLIARAADIAAMAQTNMEASGETKLRAFLESLGESLDVLAEAVVLILNQGRTKGDGLVDLTWVQENISSSRQWNIVEAQMHVNRLRDFFSRVFQSGRRTMTMTQPLGAQLLQTQPGS